MSRVTITPAELMQLITDWRYRALGVVDTARADALRECAAALEDLLLEEDDDGDLPVR